MSAIERKKTYVIIPRNKLNGLMLEESTTEERGAIKYNCNGDKALLKFVGNVPKIFHNYQMHTYAEILKIINSDEWLAPPKRVNLITKLRDWFRLG